MDHPQHSQGFFGQREVWQHKFRADSEVGGFHRVAFSRVYGVAFIALAMVNLGGRLLRAAGQYPSRRDANCPKCRVNPIAADQPHHQASNPLEVATSQRDRTSSLDFPHTKVVLIAPQNRSLCPRRRIRIHAASWCGWIKVGDGMSTWPPLLDLLKAIVNLADFAFATVLDVDQLWAGPMGCGQ
jgi:hypothetical protein